jgi:penicillin-binding protein 1C
LIDLARVALAAACLAAAMPAAALPSYAEVRAAHRPSDLTLLDRGGTPVQTLRMDRSVRRLPWVPLQDMSPALLQAIVLSEDRRFWEHSGIDWQAVAKSAWVNALNTRTRGASTLTMQLAGLIDDGLARPAGGRNVAQKIGQAVTAVQLEASWKKSEILEAYLNEVPFRGEIVGIDALAQTLFGKHPSGLDAHEAAIAAALVRAPNAPARRVAERACAVVQLQRLGCSGIAGLTEAAFARRGGMPLGEQLAPHFARQVLEPDGPARQRSTLDARLQRVALAALRQQLTELSGRNVEDGAIVVLDNSSGEVLAWVGSSGNFSDAPEVDGVLARRQPGSTLKPFVYALAFERRLITPATLLDDSPAQIATPAGLYLPQNYDRDFRGWVSARTALGSSLNVPAVRVATMLGPDAVFERFNAFGLVLPESAGFYGHALALGGAEVTLLALTNAYRALANGGVLSPPLFRQGSEHAAARRVADAAAAYLVTDILADNSARAGTFGLSNSLATRGFAAVKTGTSKDLRDNWCIGYTDRYTVGVWVGNASGAPMHDVSGVSGAAPVWRMLVQQLHDGQPSRPPALARGVSATEVVFEGAREPARHEVFLVGTEQVRQRASAQLSSGRRFGIVSPRDGSVFALDPDIPPAAQRLTFEGELGTWVLDGRRLGRSSSISWSPWPGRHELVLLGRDGRQVQTVRFEVRGVTLRK